MKQNIIKKAIVALGSALLGVIAYSFMVKRDDTLEPEMEMEDEIVEDTPIAEVVEETVSEEDKKSKKK
nr:MAG TPA: hypothetical protein [Caudoviricetes sp.]